jgi:hypothetical protein
MEKAAMNRKFWFEVFVPILNALGIDHWVWDRFVKDRQETVR